LILSVGVFAHFRHHLLTEHLCGCLPSQTFARRVVADYLMAQEADPKFTSREWIIEDIGGKGVIDNSPASLLFMSDGSLAGYGTCNRLIASYSHEGSNLARQCRSYVNALPTCFDGLRSAFAGRVGGGIEF